MQTYYGNNGRRSTYTNGKVALRGVFSREDSGFIVNFSWPAGNVAAVDENVGGKRRAVGIERKEGRKKRKRIRFFFFFFSPPNKTCGLSA